MSRHEQRQQEREQSRAAQLRELVTGLATRLPADVVRAAHTSLDAVDQRLSLGVGHTVVALVGGTGSGKSSLFNAVTGLQVADVGARRPTTSEPTASVWGSDASALLDHLGVPAERRHRGESALNGPAPGQLDGIVLLDVPDHDSVAQGHRMQVDRLLPLVDLLVWVLDPQKYADHRLHAEYLRGLSGRQDAMLVVLNQVDTLTPSGVETLRLDVARLLVAEQLGGVEVLTTSARSGEGIPSLREILHRAAERASANRSAVRAALDDVAERVGFALGDVPVPTVDLDAAVTRLAAVAGVDAVADSIGAAHRGDGVVTTLREPSRARVATIRDEWVEALARDLPATWRSAAEQALPDAASLAGAVQAALGQVAVPAVPRPGPLRRMRRGTLVQAADEASTAYREAATGALARALREWLAPVTVQLGQLEHARADVADGMFSRDA